MSTLTSVAAVAAAETLASMTKASQLFSLADTAVSQNLNKASKLSEVHHPLGKDTNANGASFQSKDSSDQSKNSKLSNALASTKKIDLSDESKNHDINHDSDAEKIESASNFVSANENGLSSVDENKGKNRFQHKFIMFIFPVLYVN